MSEHKIFQMTSFSRSGETLMQRCLSGHPQIEVVHQIHEPDTKEDIELFQFLMSSQVTTISSDHPKVAHRNLKPGTILLLKNAVWTQDISRNGFILARNPFSLVASAFRESPPPAQAKRQKLQQTRWARTIDPLMVPSMKMDPTLIGFAALYTRKMLKDIQSGLPFVRYEEFILDPEAFLRKILNHMGLKWHEDTMQSHTFYKEGELGHGGIRLWAAVNALSDEKYKKLSPETKSTIYSITHEVLRLYGYGWDGETVSVQDGIKGMI